MIKLLIVNFCVLLAAPVAQASRVAVVDSGTDFKHVMLQKNSLSNALEVPGNRVDDDRNGKVDDVVGWNFVRGSNKVFSSEHLTSINPLVYPLFRVIAHRQGGINTPEEDAFFKEQLANLGPEEKVALSAHLNYFGQYAHGTHVSGIIVEQNPGAKILSAKIFPDEPPPLYPAPNMLRADGPIDWIYKLLAIIANGTFKQVGSYIGEQKIDVANYSIGTQLSILARAWLNLKGIKEPTEAQLSAEVMRLYRQFEKEGKEWLGMAPNTLFVIAAGNDGTNNDILPAFPGNLRAENAITVAASLGYEKLATFSNYGIATVDVAAPGVSIVSSVPSLDESAMLPLSGTSMAAPFVTGVASRVKDTNPALTASQIRQVLMGTVDKKDWLADKVVASGVVNADRAVEAARLSLSQGLDAAIAMARTNVADQPTDRNGPRMMANHASTELEDMALRLVF